MEGVSQLKRLSVFFPFCYSYKWAHYEKPTRRPDDTLFGGGWLLKEINASQTQIGQQDDTFNACQRTKSFKNDETQQKNLSLSSSFSYHSKLASARQFLFFEPMVRHSEKE